jgi:hypothetical protein
VSHADRAAEGKSLSRELSVFLIQLSVGLHKYGTYPKGHPVIEHAASAVFAGLSALLLHRDGLSIGVARDQLIVEGAATDTENAVLRDLAYRLHRHQIGVIRFRNSIAPEELLEFLQTVSAEANRQEMPFGLRPAEELGRWPNIEIVPFTFEHLEIGAGDKQAEQGRSSQLWLGLASAALRRGRAGDEIDDDPNQIASAINTHREDKAYDQIIVGYLQELGRELRMREGESYTQLQSRVSQLLSSLDQETVTRLLTVGGELATRQDFVTDFASSLPVKAVLDLVQAAASAKQQTISHSLLRMLTKLADHADQGQTTVRANADATFRSAVNDLLTDWTLEDPNPDAYTMVLDQLSLPAEAAPAAGEAPDHLAEAPRILQMALELDVVGEAVWTSLARSSRTGGRPLVASLDAAPIDRGGDDLGPAGRSGADERDPRARRRAPRRGGADPRQGRALRHRPDAGRAGHHRFPHHAPPPPERPHRAGGPRRAAGAGPAGRRRVVRAAEPADRARGAPRMAGGVHA